MSKVLILKGLPASGKSTFAKKLVSGNIKAMGNNWKRINKDDLRAMFDNSHWSKANEKFIVELRNYIIAKALDEGFNVVVDDTNLAPKHEQDIKMLIHSSSNPRIVDAKLETKFFEITVDEAIKRDLARPNSVGSKVIIKMYNQFLAPQKELSKVSVYKQPKDKPKAVICDIDGTLAHMTGRSPFEWHRVGEDALDEAVAEVLKRYETTDIQSDEPDTIIIILSGRDEGCRDVTEKWLADKGIKYDHFYMRPANDNRKDSIVKREIFDEHIAGKYQIRFVLDDRDQVVKMWREMGLKVLQVAPGDF